MVSSPSGGGREQRWTDNWLRGLARWAGQRGSQMESRAAGAAAHRERAARMVMPCGCGTVRTIQRMQWDHAGVILAAEMQPLRLSPDGVAAVDPAPSLTARTRARRCPPLSSRSSPLWSDKAPSGEGRLHRGSSTTAIARPCGWRAAGFACSPAAAWIGRRSSGRTPRH